VQDDLELLGRWRDGDKRAGRELFERHFDALYRFFSSKLSGDVEDLIQVTFLACIERRKSIQNFRGYLFGTARNVLCGHFAERKRGHQFDPVESSLEDLDPSPSAVLAGLDEGKLLATLLRRLPLDMQLLLELHYWEGLTHPELAEAMSFSEGCVKGKIAAAKLRLRTTLQTLAKEHGLKTLSLIDLEQWRTSLRRPAGSSH